MRAYGYKRRSDFYAPYGTCRKCGWTGKDWGFKYHGYCKKCYRQWRKEKAERRRKLKPPNENIEVGEGVVITRNVRDRLWKQARGDIPRTSKEILWDSGAAFGALILLVTVFLLMFSLSVYRKYALPLGACAAIGYVMFFICERIGGNEARKRMTKVDARLEELARERQRQIDEANAFYASSEWRLVREQVIQEQGRLCQECRSRITNEYDLTVDHIKPRSKFPELALDKSNLQVLCRRCNSAKGVTYNEASITAQPTEPS